MVNISMKFDEDIRDSFKVTERIRSSDRLTNRKDNLGKIICFRTPAGRDIIFFIKMSPYIYEIYTIVHVKYHQSFLFGRVFKIYSYLVSLKH